MSPPCHRQWIAQASSAPITQNPGIVACHLGPLTSGETRIAAIATARSAHSRTVVRRAGSANAQTVNAVQADHPGHDEHARDRVVRSCRLGRG